MLDLPSRVHAGTVHRSRYAVSWLKEQWGAVMALRSTGVPVVGFTWGALTDEVDTQHGLRAERHEPNPVGLYDLARRARPAADEYRTLATRWGRLLDVPETGEAEGAMREAGSGKREA